MESDSMSKRKELLIRMLKDPASEVSAAAAAALEQLEGVQRVDAVLEQLKKGNACRKDQGNLRAGRNRRRKGAGASCLLCIKTGRRSERGSH